MADVKETIQDQDLAKARELINAAFENDFTHERDHFSTVAQIRVEKRIAQAFAELRAEYAKDAKNLTSSDRERAARFSRIWPPRESRFEEMYIGDLCQSFAAIREQEQDKIRLLVDTLRWVGQTAHPHDKIRTVVRNVLENHGIDTEASDRSGRMTPEDYESLLRVFPAPISMGCPVEEHTQPNRYYFLHPSSLKVCRIEGGRSLWEDHIDKESWIVVKEVGPSLRHWKEAFGSGD
jgi:hypothetical protein